MPAKTARYQHRHLKTLIVLVVAMTGGTFFLFWIGKLAPVTPLRAKVWNQIVVRSVGPTEDRGFFHFRVDQEGRLYQSNAWSNGRRAAPGEGAIYVLVSRASANPGISAAQTRAISVIVSDLTQRYHIPADHVIVDEPRRIADIGTQGEF